MASKRASRPAATKTSSSSLRLERGDDERRVFWEITQQGAGVTTRYGKLLNEGRTIARALESIAAATRFVEREVAAKRAEGYAERGPRQVVGGSARKGVSVLDPELDALVDEDPADLARYLVYADWLQQEGDPRGELVVVQHGLATEPHGRRYDALERMEAELFKTFNAELLGPLAKAVRISTSANNHRGLAWRCGFVRALRLTPSLLRVAPFLETVLHHPSLRFLEHVVLDGHDLPARVPPSVRSAHVRKLAFNPLNVDAQVWSIFPGLRAMALEANVTAFAPHDTLESLDLQHAEPENLAALGRAQLPALEHLGLTLALPDTTLDASLSRIREAFPKLRTLTVRRREYDHRNRLRPQDLLAEVVRAHAADLDLRLEMRLATPIPSVTHVAKPSEDDDPCAIDSFHHSRLGHEGNRI